MTIGKNTSLSALIEDAANILIWRGHLEPDDDDYVPDDVVDELVMLHRYGPCDVCPGWPSPDHLADHWHDWKQQEWCRSWPSWTCACGRLFKTITEFGDRTFYNLLDDGYHGPPCPDAVDGCEHSYCANIVLGSHMPGKSAGSVTYRRDGRVRHSSQCPSCKRLVADVIADRLNPQQSLFDLLEATG